ncbi:MAG: ATP-binding protein, partial [bacterium]
GSKKVVDYTSYGMKNMVRPEIMALRKSGGLVSLEIMDTSGKLFATAKSAGELFTASQEGVEESKVDEYLVQRVLNGKSEVYLDDRGSKIGIWAIVPLEKFNEIIGMMQASYLLDQSFIEELKKITTADISLFTGEELSLTTLPSESFSLKPELLNEMLSKERKLVDNMVIANEFYKIGLTPLLRKDGTLLGMIMVSLSKRGMISLASQARNRLLIIGGLGVFLAVFLGYLIAEHLISRPISKLVRGAAAISAGDLNQKIIIDTQDEIGVLAGTFNEMRKKLREAHRKLENRIELVNKELEESNKELERANKELEKTNKENLELYEKVKQFNKELKREIALATKELEESNRKLIYLNEYNDNILRCMNSGVMVMDLDGKITTLNAVGERILNLSSEELKDVSLHDIKRIEGLSRLLAKTLKTEKTYVGHEVTIQMLDKNPGNKMIPLQVSTSVLRDNNHRALGVIAVFRDISQIKQLEEQLQRSKKLAALGEMSAGVAHEIRNPLGVIKSSAQMLRDEFKPVETRGEYQELTTFIIEEVNRLNRVITEFLSFARPTPPNLQRVNINEIIDKTIQLIASQEKVTPDVKIKVETSKNLPVLMGDPEQIIQALLNIVLNSLQAMPDGGELRIAVRGADDAEEKYPASLIQIQITDTGEGIPVSIRDKIFNPFFTTKEEGSGLGLAIAHKIIENHKGFIEVESEVRKGTTFKIFLPLAA